MTIESIFTYLGYTCVTGYSLNGNRMGFIKVPYEHSLWMSDLCDVLLGYDISYEFFSKDLPLESEEKEHWIGFKAEYPDVTVSQNPYVHPQKHLHSGSKQVSEQYCQELVLKLVELDSWRISNLFIKLRMSLKRISEIRGYFNDIMQRLYSQTGFR